MATVDMDQFEECNVKALKVHKKISRGFFRGHYSKGDLQIRILDHLYEFGGGLTAKEIEDDLYATEGKEWTSDNDDWKIEAVLDAMIHPGRSLKNALESAGGFGIMGYEITRMMDDWGTIEKSDNKYFLLSQLENCKDGIDWYARVEFFQKKLKDAKKGANDLKTFQEMENDLDEKNKKLNSELESLGFFKLSEKKAVREKIEKNIADLKVVQEKIDKAQACKESIPGLEKRLSEAKKDCIKAYSDQPE